MSEYDNARAIKIVGPVNTSTDNPWRTEGEYREEQAQMLKAYRWAVASSIAAIITACLTAVLAVSAVIEIKHISQSIQEQQEGKAFRIRDNHQ
jgi:hypothetical protein